jgi:hypothetical protein
MIMPFKISRYGVTAAVVLVHLEGGHIFFFPFFFCCVWCLGGTSVCDVCAVRNSSMNFVGRWGLGVPYSKFAAQLLLLRSKPPRRTFARAWFQAWRARWLQQLTCDMHSPAFQAVLLQENAASCRSWRHEIPR